MKKREVFRGVATALVTPMKDDRIDYDSLERLIDLQISEGIDALVIGGTTGEAATLTDEERYTVFRVSKGAVGGRVPLIFGTGTNDTRAAAAHTRYASELGCDGVLVVTPYYNRGTRGGILQHYLRIAEASDVPIILYNVPTRTGCNLDIPTLRVLAEEERISGIKEASSSAERLMTLSSFGDSLYLYSGNDTLIYPTLALGGLGVISVISNLYPRLTAKICKEFFAGRPGESLKLQQLIEPVSNSLFLDTNPAPLKYAMAKRGLCREDMRLPLSPVDGAVRGQIDEALARLDALLAEN